MRGIGLFQKAKKIRDIYLNESFKRCLFQWKKCITLWWWHHIRSLTMSPNCPQKEKCIVFLLKLTTLWWSFAAKLPSTDKHIDMASYILIYVSIIAFFLKKKKKNQNVPIIAETWFHHSNHLHNNSSSIFKEFEMMS